MTSRRSLAGVVVAAMWCAPMLAQLPSPQQQRTPEEYAKFLEGAERVARMQVPRVVQSLGLKPGMKVADIGSGSGLFTRPIAKSVAPGLVYAVDIDKALLGNVKNVETSVGTADDPKLPEPVDLIFVCDTLHHIANQGPYLRMLRKYLVPGGRLAVIDFGERWPEGHEKLHYTMAEFDGWMRDAGFTRVESFDWLDNSFFILFR